MNNGNNHFKFCRVLIRAKQKEDMSLEMLNNLHFLCTISKITQALFISWHSFNVCFTTCLNYFLFPLQAVLRILIFYLFFVLHKPQKPKTDGKANSVTR